MEGDEQVSPFIEIMSIFIKSEVRQQGYGSKLLSKLIEIANEKRITCIYVKVSKDNSGFRTFLEKNKFNVSPKLLYQKRGNLFLRIRRKLSM